MVLVKPLPGQEERNTRYLVSRKAAVRAEGEAQLARAISEIMEPGERRVRVLERIAALRRPEAAVDVARRIAELVEIRRAANAR
jgi:processive 1,2-diacylglycerol beta-glucosyltransferase